MLHTCCNRNDGDAPTAAAETVIGWGGVVLRKADAEHLIGAGHLPSGKVCRVRARVGDAASSHHRVPLRSPLQALHKMSQARRQQDIVSTMIAEAGVDVLFYNIGWDSASAEWSTLEGFVSDFYARRYGLPRYAGVADRALPCFVLPLASPPASQTVLCLALCCASLALCPA
jgi:hypothetical protein